MPNSVLEVAADGGEIKEVDLGEIREHLVASDGSRRGDVAESGWNGVVAGREQIDFPEFSCGFEFSIAIAAASGLGK